MVAEKIIKDLIRRVNRTLTYYKRGGWIDCRRTPTSNINIVNSLEEFVDARFNRECFEVPELSDACDLLDGRLFICTLEEPDEKHKKYKQAKLTLVDKDDIYKPSEELVDLLESIKKFLGGSVIRFNSVKVKVKFTIEDE
jgi:hypothetical protein